jgi:hypothetical protein
MKKIFFISILVILGITANAQQKGTLRYGWDAGVALPRGGGGISGSGDIRYNIEYNWNIGLRYGAAFMIKPITNIDIRQPATDSYLVNDSYHIISDYYFNGTSSFAPFVGGGVGVYNFSYFLLNATEATLGSCTHFGALLHIGFEWEGFRVGLEYNLIPSTRLINGAGDLVGSSFNNYTNLTVGYYYTLW